MTDTLYTCRGISLRSVPESELRPLKERFANDLSARANLSPEWVDRTNNDGGTWIGEDFAVERGGVVIGTARISTDRWARIGTLAVAVIPEHRNRGVGVIACHLMLRFAFEFMGLHKVRSHVYAYNEPSLRMNRRLMTEEGANRDGIYVNGRYWDVHAFGLLRSEWEAKRCEWSALDR
jgi:RimJ/RimL family protein N-acetyltransferase